MALIIDISKEFLIQKYDILWIEYDLVYLNFKIVELCWKSSYKFLIFQHKLKWSWMSIDWYHEILWTEWYVGYTQQSHIYFFLVLTWCHLPLLSSLAHSICLPASKIRKQIPTISSLLVNLVVNKTSFLPSGPQCPG